MYIKFGTASDVLWREIGLILIGSHSENLTALIAGDTKIMCDL
jgi:hypothetical protein